VAWDVGYYHYNINSSGPNDIAGACYSPGTAAGEGVVYSPAPGYSNQAAGPPGGPCSTVTYPSDFGPGQTNTTRVDSVFGQAVVPLMANLKLTLGGRESWVTTGGSYDANADNTFGYNGGMPLTMPAIFQLATVHTSYFDFKASLEDKLTPETLLYATIASGHREGGYSFGTAAGEGPNGYVAGTAPTPYDPEHMIDYEAGIKNTLLGGRLLLNADVYYYDYKSYQLVYVVFGPAGLQADFRTYPAREYGAEAYAAFALTRNDKVTASLVYLNSRLKCGTPDGVDTTGCAYSGEAFTFSPHLTFKAEYSHDFDLGANGKVTAKGDFRILSQQLVDANDDAAAVASTDIMPGYTTGDLYLGWTSADKKYSLNGYVKNVNDKMIKSSFFFGYAQIQAPRTYGLTLKASF